MNGFGSDDVSKEPTFAEKSMKKLRETIEGGQIAIGLGGPGSGNGIVNPLRPLEEAKARAAAAAELAAVTAAEQNTDLDKQFKKTELVGTGVVAEKAPVSPRTAHANAAAAHAQEKQRLLKVEEQRHKHERKNKMDRYLCLIVCFVTIILALIGMAGISRKVIGKWWHGEEDAPKISHSVIFPHSRII